MDQRQQALDRYYAAPNYCLFCSQVIMVREGEKIQDVRRRKFCNHSHAARHTNKGRIKIRPYPVCSNCGQPKGRKQGTNLCSTCLLLSRIATANNVTKSELYARRGSYQSARSAIRKHAAQVFEQSGLPLVCFVCGYSTALVVEIAHKRAVADFPGSATLEEINAIENLVALCPTHHAEFDLGLLKL